MTEMRGAPAGADEIGIPMIFVPHGHPEPREWMARHPDWVKIPAVMVPRRQPQPMADPAPPTVAVAAAASTAAASAAELAAISEMAAIPTLALAVLAWKLWREALTIRPANYAGEDEWIRNQRRHEELVQGGEAFVPPPPDE